MSLDGSEITNVCIFIPDDDGVPFIPPASQAVTGDVGLPTARGELMLHTLHHTFPGWYNLH